MRTTRLIDLAGNPITPPKAGESIMLGKAVKLDFQTLEAWREARNATIGGSDAPAILGFGGKNMSAFTLYNLKAGLILPDDDTENEVLEWGRRFEAPVIDAYEEKTGRKIIRHGIHLFRSPIYPISVSLDGEIAADATRGPGVLEVKTTTVYSEKDLQEEIPIQWQIQIQHAMAVMGCKWGSLAVLMQLSRKFRYHDIERNDEFIQMLLEKEIAFVKRIEANDPPELDGSESAGDALKKLFPRDSGETIDLPEAALDWDRKHQQAKLEQKRWKDIEEEYGNKLRAAIGEATFGRLADGYKYSWKRQHRDSYVVQASDFRVLRKLK